MYYEGRYESKVFFSSFKYGAGKNLFPYPLHSDTSQIREDDWCSDQTRAFNALLADVADVGNREKVITEFLNTEDSSPIEIHRRLRSLCSEDAIDVSSER